MAQSYIIHVTEADFEYQVIQYSLQTPVVVDFWADWCIPCKTLGPILEELTTQNQGNFRLAKVDVDGNPKLTNRFNVRSIPAVKGFRNGQMIAEFSGVPPEAQIRKFLEELVPGQSSLQINKGNSLLEMEEWARAETAFRQVLESQPRHPAALLGLAKCLLTQGEGAKTLAILDEFPASREFGPAQQLRPLALALTYSKDRDLVTDNLLDATYQRALRLISLGNIPAAMDGLLAVLKEDKHYHNDQARQVLVAIFEILGDHNPLTRQYRAELASILY
jgi:putative thioredoxin